MSGKNFSYGKLSLSVLLMIPILLGVYPESQEFGYIEETPEFELQTSAIWENNGWFIYDPTVISLIDNYLIVIDRAGENQILVFDRQSQKLISAIGREGRGPGEYLTAWNLMVSEEKDRRFCIYDLQLRRISCYELDEIAHKSNLKPAFSLTLSGQTGIPLYVNSMPKSNEFIVTGLFSDQYRFITVDSSGNIYNQSDHIPHIRENEPVNVFQHAYIALPVSNRNGTKIAFAYFYTDVIEIYSTDGDFLYRGKLPTEHYKPYFSVRQTPAGPTMAQGSDARIAYIDIKTGNNHIFALYSGRARKERYNSQSNTIHVLDWKGQLKAIFHLDKYVESCTITPEEKKLYCLYTLREEPEIIEYELPESY